MKPLSSQELRHMFRKFFESKEHIWIPSASLLPENDPTVLFTTAGMHPLVPYLLGQSHPEGKRIASVQKCIRTDDIDEVGDPTHHTFFEMLGNWSLGDYFKQEAIEWSFEFLTSSKWLGIDPSRLAVSVFEGDQTAPFDQEAYDIWCNLGIPKARIAKLGRKDNWWGPAGQTGPCGPDTEIFYWVGKDPAPANYDPTDAEWVEIWNNVFMQYEKKANGKFVPLKQKNVDTGLGLARVTAVLNELDDDYRTDIYWPIIQKIEEISGQKYDQRQREFRIIADHATAAVMAIADGVEPSNKGAGYIVRRLIRRAITHAFELGVTKNCLVEVARLVVSQYSNVYPEIQPKLERILHTLMEEESGFRKNLQAAMAEFRLYATKTQPFELKAEHIFDFYQSKGLPLEVSLEEAAKFKIPVEKEVKQRFFDLLAQHQALSRTASAGMFKGGLQDQSEITTKYHTATHLLQAALRQVLGKHVYQRGSNITVERLRFDFSHPEKMSDEQIKEVEDLVNQKIKADLPVEFKEMTVDEAKKSGAIGVFDERYGNKVLVYSVGAFSKEICGGPHVKSTGEIGSIKIVKEEAVSSGIRRIKAVLA